MTERNQTLATTLEKGVAALGLALSSSQSQKLLDYVALLAKWNSVYNLTAIRDPQQMLIQHILDSLAIVPAVSERNPSTLLDVGSGGGLPGVVLAIAQPDVRVTLNDIVHKKTAFQSQAKAQLGLNNLSVVTGRVESLRPGIEVPEKFDVIVSRAFAELSDFVTLSRHLVADNGRILAMKGVKPDAEAARVPAGATVLGIERLNVPMLDAERHLVEIAVEPV
ncbi:MULTISPECIES: 16S rRNA (guanine(527)-N(7))-methyltransferase RsmG [unclassified Caballeronia]|jgi:16S rRNA (guanine527-N7)-methyltransferase|uniref:16S rRNA (guanine(527)-N(7))-methyltransferase RsmG n=1 Tax=unclassified Caballeronia TaxID=2646786 RepID=UPI00202928E1|nr:MULTISPECIES: 16S rRNA (guanine(527)-N(7))-methyltransferase RsmG [unclassified Caballeronia]